MSHRIRVALPLLLAAAAAAAEPPLAARAHADAEPIACREPFRADPDRTPEQLREIAAHCSDVAVARLFKQRAAHAAAMADLATMAELIRSGQNHDRMRLEQCRVYIGLVEALAARRWQQEPQVLNAVSLAYAQSLAIAERAILGYDRIVGLPEAPD
jgi:hypothetical protein